MKQPDVREVRDCLDEVVGATLLNHRAAIQRVEAQRKALDVLAQTIETNHQDALERLSKLRRQLGLLEVSTLSQIAETP